MIDPGTASGLRDLPPSATIPRERLLASFRATFARSGFVPIETPHIERTEVLTGKGAGSDEVLRQIFDVTNKGGEPGKLALRFDLTVPLARFIARHVDQLGVPFKRYAIGAVFRGERPAKGRFREFTQCDFDTVGTESAVADAEVLQVIHKALTGASVPPFTITINHRGILDGLMTHLGLHDRTPAVLRALDKLAKIGRDKVHAELTDTARGAGLTDDQAQTVLRFVTDGRGGAEVLKAIPEDVLTVEQARDGRDRLAQVLALAEAGGVPRDAIAIDLGLARGLDYYTGLVFETTINGWERYGSIASGGRYDNLASLFTTRRLPGVGGSIGLDRLLAVLQDAGTFTDSATTAPVLVAQFPGTDPVPLAAIAARLRAYGIGTELYPDPIALGKQLGYGSNRGHRLAVIVGPDEQAADVFNLRNLTTREEQKGLPLADLESRVAEALEALTPESATPASNHREG